VISFLSSAAFTFLLAQAAFLSAAMRASLFSFFCQLFSED